jgi:hypothetical protein
VSSVDPDLLERVHLHEGPVSLFDEYGVEEEIQKAFQRTVRLKSGGHVVIEPTEALVTIDVNTGKFTGKGKKDPEQTILRTNLEAARAISKQLRLRDIGGIIVIDFIDMESQENRDKVIRELRSHLGRDRARTKAFEISDLGLVEMTRQRIRPSLFTSLTDVCPPAAASAASTSPPPSCGASSGASSGPPQPRRSVRSWCACTPRWRCVSSRRSPACWIGSGSAPGWTSRCGTTRSCGWTSSGCCPGRRRTTSRTSTRRLEKKARSP